MTHTAFYTCLAAVLLLSVFCNVSVVDAVCIPVAVYGLYVFVCSSSNLTAGPCKKGEENKDEIELVRGNQDLQYITASLSGISISPEPVTPNTSTTATRGSSIFQSKLPIYSEHEFDLCCAFKETSLLKQTTNSPIYINTVKSIPSMHANEKASRCLEKYPISHHKKTSHKQPVADIVSVAVVPPPSFTFVRYSVGENGIGPKRARETDSEYDEQPHKRFRGPRIAVHFDDSINTTRLFSVSDRIIVQPSRIHQERINMAARAEKMKRHVYRTCRYGVDETSVPNKQAVRENPHDLSAMVFVDEEGDDDMEESKITSPPVSTSIRYCHPIVPASVPAYTADQYKLLELALVQLARYEQFWDLGNFEGRTRTEIMSALRDVDMGKHGEYHQNQLFQAVRQCQACF